MSGSGGGAGGAAGPALHGGARGQAVPSICLEPAVNPTTFSSAREPFSACCALETLLKSARYVDGALSATTTPPPHHSTTPSLPPQITSRSRQPPPPRVPHNHRRCTRGQHPGSSPGRCPPTIAPSAAARHELRWRGGGGAFCGRGCGVSQKISRRRRSSISSQSSSQAAHMQRACFEG